MKWDHGFVYHFRFCSSCCIHSCQRHHIIWQKPIAWRFVSLTQRLAILFIHCSFPFFSAQEAEKSLRFYRNISPSASIKGNHLFEHELSKLKCSYTEVKSKDPETAPDTSIRFSDFMNRPFAICCILMMGHEFNGVFTMVLLV